MNSYKMSNGERVTKSTIDKNIRLAKANKISGFQLKHGYLFCEECLRSSGNYLDCSHDKSVKWCQDNGQTELAWDVKNITIRCRECHKKHDKL